MWCKVGGVYVAFVCVSVYVWCVYMCVCVVCGVWYVGVYVTCTCVCIRMVCAYVCVCAVCVCMVCGDGVGCM